MPLIGSAVKRQAMTTSLKYIVQLADTQDTLESSHSNTTAIFNKEINLKVKYVDKN